jgi:hypothetical protein
MKIINQFRILLIIIVGIIIFYFVYCDFSENKKNTSLSDRCNLKPETGPCKAIYERYYYNSKERKCKSFIWGGCGGIVPFKNKEQCQRSCEK